MAHHIELGKKGEQIASDFLRANGYVIIDTNWRQKRHEIDIIARKNGILVFVEVKTRTTDAFGHPEESVTLEKQQQLTRAANAYLQQVPGEPEIRFDVVSIVRTSKGTDIHHIEDAFFLQE